MELKNTLIMPKGKFEMRGNLTIKEPQLVEYYQKIDLYKLMLEKNKKSSKTFYLHDGPAYANGDMHAGHALNAILKDAMVRFHTLLGEYSPFQPGWDTHGLPIENQVTKSGVDRKAISVAEFRKKCEEFALTQVERQKNQRIRLGIQGNFKDPYLTLDRKYEADQVSIFLKLLEDGAIYKGLKPVNWSPSSESALAEAEIEYKDVVSKTVYVRFPVKKGNAFVPNSFSIVIWTTTPWTLPANLAISVNPNYTYGLYKTDQGKLIFLESLEEKLIETLSLTNVRKLGTVRGIDMEGVICSLPIEVNDDTRTSLVICGDHVTDDAGTGCVHTAPGHGMEDYVIGQKYGLSPLCPVDSKGYMTKEAGPRLEGLFYEKANDLIIDMLTETGYLLKEVDVSHAYPHDWRTNKPLIFRATPQWFFNQKKYQKVLVKEAHKASYLPSWGKIRLSNMVEGRDEWCLSRQRAWGVPIPVIYQDGEPIINKNLNKKIIKLIREHGSNVWYEQDAEFFLTDDIKRENHVFTKENDIMDVWFDSGSSFLAADINRKYPFPADVYFEGSDQYRGWYNASLILSTVFKGYAPFKKIITHGFIVDQNGEKFSKSKKNGINPNDIVKTYGADILRLWTTNIDYNMAEIKFTDDLIKASSESYRKIRNVFKFMLSNLYDDSQSEVMFDSTKFDVKNLRLIDKLLLNRFKKLLNDCKKKYKEADFLQIYSMITNFLVNDLSAIYLDFNKDNLYCNAKDANIRKSCQYTMFYICKNLAIVLSPIMPFTMDEVYYFMNIPDKQKSIALESWPNVKVDATLLEQYKRLVSFRDHANKVIEVGRRNSLYKGNNEVSLTLALNKEEKETLKLLGKEEIRRFLNVSSFEEGKEDLAVHHVGHKCSRCWNYFDEVEEVEGETLCHRCHEVVNNGN